MKTGKKSARILNLLLILLLVFSLAGCGTMNSAKQDSKEDQSTIEDSDDKDSDDEDSDDEDSDDEDSDDEDSDDEDSDDEDSDDEDSDDEDSDDEDSDDEDSDDEDSDDEDSDKKDSDDEDSDKKDSDNEDSDKKSDGYEKFSKLKIGMTESEVNEILGEPTSVDKAYYTYNVTVNGNDMELTVWINTVSGLVVYLRGDFVDDDYRDEFADSETDLSKVDKLDSGDIDTYDACKEAFKTPGYVICIEEEGETEYLWVDSNGGYLTVSFDAEGNVKSYNGYC